MSIFDWIHTIAFFTMILAAMVQFFTVIFVVPNIEKSLPYKLPSSFPSKQRRAFNYYLIFAKKKPPIGHKSIPLDLRASDRDIFMIKYSHLFIICAGMGFLAIELIKKYLA